MVAHEVQEGPMDAFTGALKLFCTRDMLLLSVTFIYTGEFDLYIIKFYCHFMLH